MTIKTADIVLLGLLSISPAAPAQASAPRSAKFCELVGSPAMYNGALITTAAMLSPGDHSLLLHSGECEPKKGFDVRAQALLPARLESLPHGRKLESILNHGRGALVELTGTFEASAGPYGPDVMPFRFVITRLHSVTELRQRK